MHSQHGAVQAPAKLPASMIRLACLLGMLCWRAAAGPANVSVSAPGHPSTNLDFEVDGVVFRNRSLGLDRVFDALGHQCSPGRPQPPAPADRLTYTPNRRWPSDAKHGRTALVVVVGGPPQRFLQRMEVGSCNSHTSCSYLPEHTLCMIPVKCGRTADADQ